MQVLHYYRSGTDVAARRAVYNCLRKNMSGRIWHLLETQRVRVFLDVFE